ncbi:MAG: hypothetical protein WCQ47_01085 [bacterium]
MERKKAGQQGQGNNINVDEGFSIDGELVKLKPSSTPAEVTITQGPKINFITPIVE